MEHGSQKPGLLFTLLVGLSLGFVIGKVVSAPPAAPTTPAGKATQTQARFDEPTLYKVTLDDAPARGNAAAPVTIVEFSDFQCPYCGRAYQTVSTIEREYGSKVRLVYKQFPLDFHQNARPAALAALAAAEQGKFWEMYDLLFTHQTQLDAASLEKYAQQAGLDVAKWKADLANPALAKKIEHDVQQGRQLGVTGTPAFFINGRKMVGAQPIDQFRANIDAELARAQDLMRTGVRPEAVYETTIAKGVLQAPVQQQPNRAPQGPVVKKIDIPDEVPSFGPKNAKVTIVEWSDFQCPFCGRAAPGVEEIRKSFPKDVRFVFRNLPLQMHPNAHIAAQAAMAAFLQGKFWEMHDVLFAHQRELSQDKLFEYAQQIGLNMAKFEKDFSGQKVADLINRDMRDAGPAGVSGTPTFYIDGHQQVGAMSPEQWKGLIQAEIERADKLLGQGVKPDQLYEKMIEEQMKGATQPAAAKIEIGQAPAIGPKNAPVTIVEWSDFQCPYCGKMYPVLKQVEEQYKGKVRLVFKNEPLPFHQNARPAAEAALAAGAQGKFWEMHDLLFTHQGQLDRASLEGYAEQLKLNLAKFKSDLDSNAYEKVINSDAQQGMALGANGTPTFFINGRQVVGYMPYESFKSIIDEELGKVVAKK